MQNTVLCEHECRKSDVSHFYLFSFLFGYSFYTFKKRMQVFCESDILSVQR